MTQLSTSVMRDAFWLAMSIMLVTVGNLADLLSAGPSAVR